jgi:hypothetical protein
VILADMRDPDSVLGHPDLRGRTRATRRPWSGGTWTRSPRGLPVALLRRGRQVAQRDTVTTVP